MTVKKEIQELPVTMVKKLKELGITAKTENDARLALVKALKKFDVDEVELDPIEDLINIYEAFVEIDGKPESDEETEESDDVVEVPKKKASKSAKKVEKDSFDEPLLKHEDEPEEETASAENKKVTAKAKKASKPDTKKESVKKTVNKRSKNSERFDGGNKKHVQILKDTFSFVEGFDLRMEFKKTYVKFLLIDSVSNRRVFQCEKITIEDGKVKSLFIVFFSLNLIDGDKVEILEDMVSEELYESISVVAHCDAVQIKVTDSFNFEKILTKKNVNILKAAIATLDKRMQKRHDKMVEEFGKEE